MHLNEHTNEVDRTQGVRCNVPAVIREEGFEVRIYTFDHPPPHVHVAKAGAIVRIDLATHEVTEIVGDISGRSCLMRRTIFPSLTRDLLTRRGESSITAEKHPVRSVRGGLSANSSCWGRHSGRAGQGIASPARSGTSPDSDEARHADPEARACAARSFHVLRLLGWWVARVGRWP
jgi:hypothetical protein